MSTCSSIRYKSNSLRYELTNLKVGQFLQNHKTKELFYYEPKTKHKSDFILLGHPTLVFAKIMKG